jgi:hypothetical protein
MAHSDLNQLLNALLPFAQQMLVKNGEFYPFGASIGFDGKISSNVASEGDEQPPSQEIIDALTEIFRKSATNSEIKAAGICFNVRVVPPEQTEKADAICVSLEHIEGDSIELFLPYKKNWLGKVNYGELFATERMPRFFVNQK